MVDAPHENSMKSGSFFMKSFDDIVYAGTPQRPLRLDLRLPDSPATPPLVLYIPMGGMRSCPKEAAPYWLVDQGFAMASIEARTSSEAIAPAAVHDCKAAVRWLRAHADEYRYDGDAIGAWGHSAGGLLAALLATSGDRSELEGDGPPRGLSSKVQAAVDCCGSPHDLMYFAKPGIKRRFAPVAENLRLYLGGELEEKAELARLVSPRTYVSPDCPPIFIIHGDRDSVVPVEESIEFHEELRAAGVDSRLRILPDIDHSWPEELTRHDIVAFFQRTLR